MKSSKPSREDLLHELESIYSSLLADGEELVASGATPTSATPSPLTNTAAPARNYPSDNQVSSNPKSALPTSGINRQQSLFVPDQPATPSLAISSVIAVGAEENTVDESKDEPVTVLENPFLPRHIRERLEQERSLYEREIEAASRLQTKYRKVDSTYNKYQPLIDDVVAHFMPKIEAELRVRLQKMLAAEGDK